MGCDRREVVAIFVGGALGGGLRTWLSGLAPSHAGQWPWATFAVDVVGCFVLGCFVTRLRERLPVTAYRRRLLRGRRRPPGPVEPGGEPGRGTGRGRAVGGVDTPANVRRSWPVLEPAARQPGLVTSELVPAWHAFAGGRAGRLALAGPLA